MLWENSVNICENAEREIPYWDYNLTYGQEINLRLLNPKFQYRILIQLNPVHNLISEFFGITSPSSYSLRVSE